MHFQIIDTCIIWFHLGSNPRAVPTRSLEAPCLFYLFISCLLPFHIQPPKLIMKPYIIPKRRGYPTIYATYRQFSATALRHGDKYKFPAHPNPTPYEILNVAPGALASDIKKRCEYATFPLAGCYLLNCVIQILNLQSYITRIHVLRKECHKRWHTRGSAQSRQPITPFSRTVDTLTNQATHHSILKQKK